MLSIRDAAIGFTGSAPLWTGLDLDIPPGEFVVVLGANGSGKTTLLRSIMGLQTLSAGSIALNGLPPQRARRRIGYIPQQRRLDPLTPLRARDLVGFGVDGHRWGPSRLAHRRDLVDNALAEVGASDYADSPVAVLSGGQQQLIRIAQALIGNPSLLMCDEPLVSLDLHYQQAVTSLIDRRRREHSTPVLFVTHEINPVLPFVDRVLYLANGRFRIGLVREVLTSATLSELYGAPVDVVRVNGRIIVSGAPSGNHADTPDSTVVM